MTHNLTRDALGQSLVDQDLVIMPDGVVLRFHASDVMFPIRSDAYPGDLYESLHPRRVDISKAIRVDVTLDDLWEHLGVNATASGWWEHNLRRAAKLWHERRSA